MKRNGSFDFAKASATYVVAKVIVPLCVGNWFNKKVKER